MPLSAAELAQANADLKLLTSVAEGFSKMLAQFAPFRWRRSMIDPIVREVAGDHVLARHLQVGDAEPSSRLHRTAHIASRLTHMPPSRLDRRAASTKATPATPSSIPGNKTSAPEPTPDRRATIAAATSE